MLTCQTCNNEYNIGEMADWTICYNCLRFHKISMDYVYVDSLGIGWTEHDLRKAGGIREVEKLCKESNQIKSNKAMKPSLPRFIYFTTEHGQYILCTEHPFVVGQVWKFTSFEPLSMLMQDLKHDHALSMVEGYNVLIAINGSLMDENISDFTKDATEMSSFFLSRINERPMGWKRYKIEKV